MAQSYNWGTGKNADAVKLMVADIIDRAESFAIMMATESGKPREFFLWPFFLTLENCIRQHRIGLADERENADSPMSMHDIRTRCQKIMLWLDTPDENAAANAGDELFELLEDIIGEMKR